MDNRNLVRILFLILSMGWTWGSNQFLLAQIIPDRTLPVNSVVTSEGTVFILEGGTQRGGNLFHSFESFSLPTGNEAFFNNASNIENIITRVTGSELSNIDGLLRTNGTANFFFLNPNGIQFGTQASLEIGGNFIGSTAESLLFEDGTEFSATNPDTAPLLTINVPLGLQLGENPGNLVNQSRVTDSNGQIVGLQVNSGQTLGLIGGNIILEGGYLTAPQGQIELGTVANAFVSFSSGRFTYEDSPSFGDIQLSQGARINTSGTGGGRIHLQGEQISLQDGSQILSITQGNQAGEELVVNSDRLTVEEFSLISASTLGSGEGGDIFLNVKEEINLIGTSFDAFQVPLVAGGVTGTLNLNLPLTGVINGSEGDGNAGEVLIQTSHLNLQNGAVVFTPALGTGDGGNINVEAQQIDVRESGLVTSTNRDSEGNAGSLTLETGILNVTDGAVLLTSTLGNGDGGLITVNASESIQLSNALPTSLVQTGLTSASLFGTGAAGELFINTPMLTVDAGGFLSTSSGAIIQDTIIPLGGTGGNLTINASTLEVRGISSDGRFPSSIRTRSLTAADAGNLTLNLDNLVVEAGANISTSSFNTGNGGSLTVNATDSIQMRGIGLTNLEQDLIIPALTGSLVPTDQIPGLAAATVGLGEAGNIFIDTPELILTEGAVILTPTFGQGTGGNLTIRASQNLDLDASLLITATALESSGNAGDIFIETPQLIIQNGGLILSTTLGRGRGGDISIAATEFIHLLNPPESSLLNFNAIGSNTALGTGTAGDMTINTPKLTLQDGGTIFSGSGFVFNNLMLSSQGEGGNIFINASDSIQLINPSNFDFQSQISTTNFGNANSGDLTLVTPSLTVNGNSTVNVSSIGVGNAANLEIVANEILLDNGGQLTASTVSGEGGNINLEVQDLLLLRNNSLISAEAGGTGNGGNIEIQSPFIVAIPTENSDVIANAFEGQGGNITLTASGVFGLQFRDELTPLSDITVSSQLGNPGNVEIIAPDVDTRSELIELPTELNDSTQQIVVGCKRFQGNSFNVTGRGGLPEDPTQLIRGQTWWRDWQDFALQPQEIISQSQENELILNPRSKYPIVEATNWRINEDGNVELIAILPSPSSSMTLNCQILN